LKVAEDLQIECIDFDAKLLDIFAEILAVLQLSNLGASDFIPLLTKVNLSKSPSQPDFRCQLAGQSAAVEVKNLRQHRFAEAVMLEAYLDASVRSGVKPRFALVMLPCDRGALGRNDGGEKEIRKLIARISDYRPNENHTVELPGGKIIHFRLEEGGDSRDESAITLDDFVEDQLLTSEFLEKITRDTTKALKQLDAPSVQDVERRIVALRWDVPFYSMLRSNRIYKLLHAHLDPILSAHERRAEVLVFTDFGIEFETVRR
jgi:hypothetical protein